jgi:hypothetical protein
MTGHGRSWSSIVPRDIPLVARLLPVAVERQDGVRALILYARYIEQEASGR